MRRAYSASLTALRQWPARPGEQRAAHEEAHDERRDRGGAHGAPPGRRGLDAQGPRHGQAATHDRQPKHSSELTRASRSTGRFAGQALVHSPQSMHEGAWRVTLSGERSDTAPSSAPYGQR